MDELDDFAKKFGLKIPEPATPEPPKQRILAPKEDDKAFRGFFEGKGFKVNRTFGKAINQGSLHPYGLAADISIHGKTDDEIGDLVESALQRGYRLFDERVPKKGVKQTGPHLHFERNNGNKPSEFLDGRYGKRDLIRLRELDDVRLGRLSQKKPDEFSLSPEEQAIFDEIYNQANTPDAPQTSPLAVNPNKDIVKEVLPGYQEIPVESRYDQPTRSYTRRDVSKLPNGAKYYEFEKTGKVDDFSYLGQSDGRHFFKDVNGDEYSLGDDGKIKPETQFPSTIELKDGGKLARLSDPSRYNDERGDVWKASGDKFSNESEGTRSQIEELKALGEASAKGEARSWGDADTQVAYSKWLKERGYKDEPASIQAFNDERKAQAKADAENEFRSQKGYDDYLRFVQENKLDDKEFEQSTIDAYNEDIKKRTNLANPTPGDVQRAERIAKLRNPAQTPTNANKGTTGGQVYEQRVVGQKSDSLDTEAGTYVFDKSRKDRDRIVREALLNIGKRHNVTTSQVNEYIATLTPEQKSAISKFDLKTGRVTVPMRVVAEMKGDRTGDTLKDFANQTEVENRLRGDIALEQSQNYLSPEVSRGKAGLMSESDAIKQLEEQTRQEETEKAFQKTLSPTLTQTLQMAYNKWFGDDKSIQQEIDEAAKGRYESALKKYGSASEAEFAKNKQFKGMGLGYIAPALTEATKGLVVDNVAPLLEASGLVRNGVIRYIGNQDTNTSDTFEFRIADSLRNAFEKGLPDGEILGDGGLSRAVGQGIGTILSAGAVGVGLKGLGLSTNLQRAVTGYSTIYGVGAVSGEAYRTAKQNGATEDQANLAAFLSAPGGLVEGLSERLLIGKLTTIKQLDKATGGKFSGAIMGRIKNISQSALENGFTESVLEEIPQAIISETAAQIAYKGDKRAFDDFLKDVDDAIMQSLIAFPVGAIIGGGVGGFQEIQTKETLKPKNEKQEVPQSPAPLESKPLAENKLPEDKNEISEKELKEKDTSFSYNKLDKKQPEKVEPEQVAETKKAEEPKTKPITPVEKKGDKEVYFGEKASAERVKETPKIEPVKPPMTKVEKPLGKEAVKEEAKSPAVKPIGKVKEPKPLTSLDVILDRVEKDGEVNIKLQDKVSPEQLNRVQKAAEARGMNATFDGKNILVRKNPAETPATKPVAKEPMRGGKLTKVDPAKRKQVTELLNQYEDTGEISSVNDLVGRVENLDIPELDGAVAQYRREQRDDAELKGRGDMDTADEAFLSAIRPYTSEEGKPVKTDVVKESPKFKELLRAIETAEDLDPAMLGKSMREVNSNEEMEAIRQAYIKREAELESITKPTTKDEGGNIPSQKKPRGIDIANATQAEWVDRGVGEKFTDFVGRSISVSEDFLKDQHRHYVQSALKSGELTPERAKELGHFEAYPELAETKPVEKAEKNKEGAAKSSPPKSASATRTDSKFSPQDYVRYEYSGETKEGFVTGTEGKYVFIEDAEGKVDKVLEGNVKKEQEFAKSAIDQPDTKEFKNWFGDSKVVDENGQPLVVYHGTANDFTEFKATPSKRTSGLGSLKDVESPSFFFTPNEDVARMFARNRAEYQYNRPWLGRTMPVYLRIEKPLDLTRKNDGTVNKLKKIGIDLYKYFGYKFQDWRDSDFAANLDADSKDFWIIADNPRWVQKIRQAGYDGVIFNEGRHDDDSFQDDRRKGRGKSYAVFEPTQIKSVFNQGTYDPNNPDIAKRSRDEIEAFGESFKNVRFESNEDVLANYKPESIVNEGDGIIGIEDVYEYELLRRLMVMLGENKNTFWLASILEPNHTDRLLDALEGVRKEFKSKALLDLKKKLLKAKNERNGHIILILDEGAMPEERFQRALNENRIDNRAKQIPQDVLREISDSPEFQKALNNQFGRNYKNEKLPMKVEEFIAKIVTNQFDELGFDENDIDKARELVIKFIWGFKEANGEQALENLASEIAYVQEIQEQVRQFQKEPKRDRQESKADSETRSERSQVDGESEADFVPSGKVKESQTPKSLRGKADIEVGDRTYVGVTNPAQQEFADNQLDKGTDKAQEWFDSQVDDNNLNSGATAVVGLNLLNHYAKTRQISKLNQVADKLVPFITEVAQTLQAMSIVSSFDPARAAAYAAKIKKQRRNKPLTEDEARRAEEIAIKLNETAQADAIADKAIEEAEQLVRELTQEQDALKSELDAVRNENKKIKVDLTEAKKAIKKLRAELDKKPRTAKAKLIKELTETRAERMARIQAKYGEFAKSVYTYDDFEIEILDDLDNNASGDSSASIEAINRLQQEKNQRTQRVVMDTRSGRERPLIGVDAVDYNPRPYERVLFRGGLRDGEVIQYETAKSVAPTQIDDDIIDEATLILAEGINEMSVEQFKTVINTITNNAFSPEQINEIHAEAVENIKANRKPSDEQKAALKNRNAHYRDAQKHWLGMAQKAMKPAKADRLAESIARVGVENGYSDEAILFAMARKNKAKLEDATKAFKEEYPDITPREMRKVMEDADRLITDAKTFIKDRAIQVKNQFSLTQSEIESLKQEKKDNEKAARAVRAEADRFYKGLSQTGWQVAADTVVNLRKANLLTGIKTHLRNLTGNVAFGASEEVSRVIGWMADVAMSGYTGERTTDIINPISIGRALKNIVKVDDTLKNAGKDSGVQRALQILKYGSTFAELEKQQHLESAIEEKFENAKARKAAKWMDAYINGVFRTLGAEDALFKVYAFRRSLEEQARTRAITEKRSDKSVNVKERTKELTLNPSNEMIAIADQFADFMTFQNENKISETFGKVKRISPAIRIPSEIVVPYDRTPTNIFLRALEYTPAGFAKAAKKAYDMKQSPSDAFRAKMRSPITQDLMTKDDFNALPQKEQRKIVDAAMQKVWSREQQREFAKTFGRAGTGSALFTMGFFMAAAGLLTGSLDGGDDEERDKFFERKKIGVENRSLLIPRVGRFVLPDDPAMKILTAGATLYEQLEMNRGDKALGAWNAVKETTGDIIFEQPYMRSTLDLYRTARRGSYGQFAGNVAGGYVPTLISDVGEVLDTKPRTTSGSVVGLDRKTFTRELQFQGRGARNSFFRRVPILREYMVPESTGSVSDEERGGILRRAVRMVDLFNTRSPQPYSMSRLGLIGSPHLKRMTTDEVVSVIEFDLTSEDVPSLKSVLKDKAINARKAGTLTQEEVDRIKSIMPEFKITPRVKKK